MTDARAGGGGSATGGPIEIGLLTSALDSVEEVIAVCVAVRDGDGTYLGAALRYANRFARDRWLGPGTPLEAVIGRDLYEVAPHTRVLAERHERVLATGEPFLGIVEVPHAAGPRWIDLHLVRLGDGFVITSRDVMDAELERRRAAASEERFRSALAASEERFRDLVSGVDAIVTLDDEATGLAFVSPQAERILGHPPERLADQGFWRSILHPDDAPWVLPLWDQDPTDDEIEYRMIAADGRVVWLRERTTRQVDPDRGLDRWFGVAVDVTERKTLEDQLERARRMESLGRLASGIAHDFNNVLYGISILAGYLVRDLPEGPRREDARQIVEAVDRGTGLTRQLLTFSRGGSGRVERTNVASVVSGVASMLELLFGGAISVETSSVAATADAMVERHGLEQALVNLATNARDAMPDGGRLEMRTDEVVLDDDASLTVGVEPGRYVRIVVTDTGGGIAPEIAARIFEPFASTKPVETGTGLGLSNVYSFVRAAQGAIGFESRVGGGTSFTIHLPAADPG